MQDLGIPGKIYGARFKCYGCGRRARQKKGDLADKRPFLGRPALATFFDGHVAFKNEEERIENPALAGDDRGNGCERFLACAEKLAELSGCEIFQQAEQFFLICREVEMHRVGNNQTDHGEVHHGEHDAPEDSAPKRCIGGEIEIEDIDKVAGNDEAAQDQLVAKQEARQIKQCSGMHDIFAGQQAFIHCEKRRKLS